MAFEMFSIEGLILWRAVKIMELNRLPLAIDAL
jgi:hypothetical protein